MLRAHNTKSHYQGHPVFGHHLHPLGLLLYDLDLWFQPERSLSWHFLTWLHWLVVAAWPSGAGLKETKCNDIISEKYMILLFIILMFTQVQMLNFGYFLFNRHNTKRTSASRYCSNSYYSWCWVFFSCHLPSMFCFPVQTLCYKLQIKCQFGLSLLPC